ncbi:MAG: uracil phosphoribosyltransferase [Bacteroidia bacterium]
MESLKVLSHQNSILNSYLAEMRDVEHQKDSHRFRENLESIGAIMAYEISKDLSFKTSIIETPLAQAKVNTIEDNIVVVGIMRAALPFQSGMLKAFRNAESAFIAAYRKHTEGDDFEIVTEYEAKPNLNDKIVVIADPMCATARSMITCYEKLTHGFKPKKVIFASIFASEQGVDNLHAALQNKQHYTCVVDKELNAKSYIVPGLGDAGDLAFGEKL